MTIVSKYSGKCKLCGGRFAEGDRIEWSRSLGARHLTGDECEAAKTAPPPAPDAVANLKPIADFMLAAREDGGLKFPKLRVLHTDGRSELVLGVTGPKSQVPGSVTVRLEWEYLGLVRPTGEAFGNFSAPLVDRLLLVAENPAKAAQEFAALSGRCSFCYSEITDEGSVEVGYGPICARRWGLPHTPKGSPALSAGAALRVSIPDQIERG